MNGLQRSGRALRRTAIQAVPTIVVIVLLNFVLLQMAPGDAVDVLAGEAGSATAETMAAMRERFGLDLPAVEQFVNYIAGLAQFSLGQSPRFGMPVTDLILERLPGTLMLMGLALTIALVLGLAAGTVMAMAAGRPADRILSVLCQVVYSVPSFWIGLMLIILFSVQLGWLPSGGSGTIGARLGGWDLILDRARYLALPALSLGLLFVAIYARLTRAAVLEVRDQDYVRTAIAKGLTPWAVTTRHILRNALIPITTLAGMHIGGILGGAVVVETVFNWPGLGRLAYEAVLGRDYNVLLGILLFSAVLVILINLVVDLVQAWLDPRIGVR